MNETDGGVLSDDEFRTLAALLARFATHELDQFENWRIETSHGPVYVVMANALPPGSIEDAFKTVWPLPDHLYPPQSS
jgi:hypothetical protein